MKELKNENENRLLVGFSFSNILEINRIKGRCYSDHLIKCIADELTEKLSCKMDFYRLEGIHFIAMVDLKYISETIEELVIQIRDIVKENYQKFDIVLPNVCFFSVMEYPNDLITPENTIENVVSLIKVAKQNPNKLYVDYSTQNLCQIKQMSDISLALIKDVLNGMKNFRIIIQPVVFSENGNIVGGEVLLRWSYNNNDISPSIFIPILEKENLINIVGKWVFEQTVCTCMRIVSYKPDFYLAFNISIMLLYDNSFLNFMEEILKKYNFDGSHLVVELTENCIYEQPEKLRLFIEGCKNLNIQIALDDFGSGYSSFKMLLKYQLNIINLDSSLLVGITESEEKRKFISSIVYSCHMFGKKVCVKGIETELQNMFIKQTGCDMVQGNYYFQHMELKDIYKY